MPLDASGFLSNTTTDVKDVYLDFETFCHISVVDVGAWRYSEHPSCEVLCLAYSLDGREIQTWIPGQPLPQDLLDAVANGARVHAHNAVFEYAIWTNVLGWPPIPLSQLHCTMALVATFSYPLSLEKAGLAIGANTQKDKEGKRLLRKFSQLQKSQKKIDKGRRFRIFPKDEPEEFQKLVDYCVTDVRAEMAILKKLPRKQLSKSEHEVFCLDFLMNQRGVKLDVKGARHLYRLADEYTVRMEEEASELTGGIRTSQRNEILKWSKSRSYELSSYTADYLDEVLARDDVPADVRRVIEIRREIGKASVKKYAKILEVACKDGTAKGMVQYHGAQRTGRFAGRLLQVHNLPRGSESGIHEVAEFARWLTLDDFIVLYGNPMEAFSSMIRSMIVAAEGHELFVSDFANIEGRVLVWMAGQKNTLKQFAANDDVYKHMAAVIFHTTYDDVTKDQRFVGKQAVLGCGYGMGGPKFLDTCLGYGQDIGIDLATKAVKAWRKTNNKVVKSWYDLEGAAKQAIRNPGKTTYAFKCKIRMEGKNLYIQLPSKRPLCYVDAKVVGDRITYMGVDQFTGQWVRQETYGGKLVENVVQAVARDFLVAAMIRIEKAGYEMLTTIHDELVATREIGEGNIEEFDRIMAESPPWGEGCPTAVEGFVAQRYRK